MGKNIRCYAKQRKRNGDWKIKNNNTLIEADLQHAMRTYLNDNKEELIEEDERISKSNHGSRKNYSIENVILEKRLAMGKSLISCKKTISHLTDLKSCYDWQLANIGGSIEESIGRDQDVMKMLTKLMQRWKHCVSAACGISEEYHGENECKLAGTGQRNKFTGDVCRDASCIIIKVLENEKLGMKFKSKLSQMETLISAIAFVDDVDLVAEGKEVEKR